MRKKGETEQVIADLLKHIEERRRTDPPYLDQPLGNHGEVLVSRTGMNLETGLYVARLTGAFPYTNVKARWMRKVRRSLLDEVRAGQGPLRMSW